MEDSRTAYRAFMETALSGRYITPEHLDPLLKKYAQKIPVYRAGQSVEGRPIWEISLGEGPMNILIWSQMHGNETTTTKAVWDLVSFLQQLSPLASEILSGCTLRILPMLNPDGAYAYTRENAAGVDLNRDAGELSQPESAALRQAFEDFAPDFCFNLHDQRSIYNVGNTPQPATLSLLAPASDRDRSIGGSRAVSMQLIAVIAGAIGALIPGKIGRYDDAYNPNCVGDTFQGLGVATLLFEAGHYPADYMRERSREYLVAALIAALTGIARKTYTLQDVDGYFHIPENNKRFYDVIIRSAGRVFSRFENTTDVGILYREELRDKAIAFLPAIEETGNLSRFFGHMTYDCAVPEQVQKLLGEKKLVALLN